MRGPAGFANSIPRSRGVSWLPAESLADLQVAAEERYWEAVELATCGEPKRTAAIYLLGYAAEMILKVALYRAMFGPVVNDVNEPPPSGGASPMREAKKAVTALHGSASGRINFHELDLIYKALSIERLRTAPIDPTIHSLLDGYHIPLLSSHWEEWLRYRPERALEGDLREVFEAIEFLRSNQSHL